MPNSSVPEVFHYEKNIDTHSTEKYLQLGLEPLTKNIVKLQFIKAFHKARKNPGLKLGFKAFIAF